MAVERVGDMTKAELEGLLDQLIEQKMRSWLGGELEDKRSPKEIFESVRRNMLKPKPGQPSTLDMIRRDRDN